MSRPADKRIKRSPMRAAPGGACRRTRRRRSCRAAPHRDPDPAQGMIQLPTGKRGHSTSRCRVHGLLVLHACASTGPSPCRGPSRLGHANGSSRPTVGRGRCPRSRISPFSSRRDGPPKPICPAGGLLVQCHIRVSRPVRAARPGAAVGPASQPWRSWLSIGSRNTWYGSG